MRMRFDQFRLLIATLLPLLLISTLSAADPVDPVFAGKVLPILKQHCFSCHTGDKAESDFAIDRLMGDVSQSPKQWNAVFERLNDGSMPPKEKPRPSVADRKAVADWLYAGLKAQAARNATQGRAQMRRLNRIEYNNTIRDLLGIEFDVTEMLPDDGSASGFDNVDVALDLSSTLLERYLEVADTVLRATLEIGPPPKQVWNNRIEVADAARERAKKYPTGQSLYGQARIDTDHILVLNDQPIPRVVFDRVPAAGRYRYRVCAASNALDKDEQVAMRVYSGVIGSAGRIGMSGVYPVSQKPAVFEFVETMEKNEAIGVAASGVTRQYNLPKGYEGPGLMIYWVEIQGPLADPWPPVGYTKLLGTIDPAKGTRADAEVILRRFTTRAFRRPVKEAEIAPILALMNDRFAKGAKFADALRVGLKAVLCSPDFLYLKSNPGKLNDFELASRLSYFLWTTMPDQTLLDLAGKGELAKPDVLRAQVERMLFCLGSHGFTENFTGQWLNLRNLKATDPDAKLYPEFDPLLEWSMPRETHLFFEEIVKNDRSLLEFIQSDWSMLNGRLAALYGIPGIRGQQFRKVALPTDSHRGGVLTQASVLKVTANGTSTSPVLRGAWVLDRILGKPAPPPPNDVPAIEPDIRGATTIREQLAKHRSIAACASCHTRIDPPGFALESFDVIGGFRQKYRVTGSTKYRPTKSYDFRSVYYADGPSVECADQMADGRKFADIDSFKKILLTDKDQIARNLAEKLLVYATGHGLEPGDRETVDQVVAAIRTKNYGFRTLIHEIVQSDAFRNK